ncbi:MAG: aminotransferase class I/II-fold pyridoxal phosphate-dependent enzyme [Rhodospirillaceae bacterium]|nr:aminotransferase class I/II-fold pyridoxal phosphate-dependent enzyme [Rhodospirillaceae bacterium]MBT4426117.1 aminotransferase class I/II-fold pyridoxal phosphate-dependent enzyme [Rhodospirillaceae bacterium]MBT5037979.1 aminotransferase class I/II-fold pyridoxal phosphate-dependent enzyme [Rhodospirillaceae bacterium]MBT5675197.1 aminotransferase class I/II-fold pyridoxal phosphate-dependent enzyme [Rhodospirillaceae bacterium]MBT5778077.1 aminotransferase class I/II-fold pyridoxal phosp
MKISKRSDVAPFYAMEILKSANEMADNGAEIMHMEAGEPGSGAPSKVLAAAHAALDSSKLGYTESEGDPMLRARIAQHYQDYYGQTVAPEQIAVTMGSSGGLLLAFLTAFDVGDRIAMAEPGYPAYRNTLSALGLEVVGLPAGPETRFQPTVELLERLDKPVQGLIVASPSNPTGTMIPRTEFEAVVKYCDAQGIRIISDEIYHGITYGEPAETVLAFTGNAVVANGFSKYFAMTGWRLGWIIVPPDFVRPIERLAQNMFISPPTLAQLAAIAAFDCREELDLNVARYAENRKILQRALPEAGFGDLAPCDGAFYVYADVTRLTNDSEKFCRQMLQATGVAATPGIDFDTGRGNHYVRFSFAADSDTVARAADALIGWLKPE